MELLGAHLGAQIISFLKHHMQIQFTSVTLWTDSKCVLSWYHSSKLLPIFIRNRIERIRKGNINELRYIPAHLLNTPHLNSCNLPQFSNNITYHSLSKDGLINLYRHQQKVLNSFWQTWRGNYLQFIKKRSHTLRKKRSEKIEPKVGDIVQISNNDKPRIQWKIGKITKLHLGRNNCIRSVDICLPNSTTLRRPVTMVFPLEHQTE